MKENNEIDGDPFDVGQFYIYSLKDYYNNYIQAHPHK